MKVEIEDYFGSTMVTLDFPQMSESFWGLLKERIEDMAAKRGFNVADYENEHHMRLQHVNVDETENDDWAFYKMVKKISRFCLI